MKPVKTIIFLSLLVIAGMFSSCTMLLENDTEYDELYSAENTELINSLSWQEVR